jgi:hypothetical protein
MPSGIRYAEVCDESTPRESDQRLHGNHADDEGVIPAMVDACNLGARRHHVIDLVSHGPFVPVFEAKYREALVPLTTQQIEEITERRRWRGQRQS